MDHAFDGMFDTALPLKLKWDIVACILNISFD